VTLWRRRFARVAHSLPALGSIAFGGATTSEGEPDGVGEQKRSIQAAIEDIGYDVPSIDTSLFRKFLTNRFRAIEVQLTSDTISASVLRDVESMRLS